MITVMFPSRKRPLSLLRSYWSLISTASAPHRIQFIVAVDPDDPATSRAAYQLGSVTVVQAPERYGYARQQHYWNAMLHHASGDWLMVWGDDALMQTRAWDDVIGSDRKPAVLWPRANGPEQANCFPVIPAAWPLELGRFTPSAHPDTYWQHVGQALNRHVPIPVEIIHNRFDLTGGHNDDTYREGRGLLGPEGMADHLADPELVAGDAERIRCAGLLGC